MKKKEKSTFKKIVRGAKVKGLKAKRENSRRRDNFLGGITWQGRDLPFKADPTLFDYLATFWDRIMREILATTIICGLLVGLALYITK
jgi:vacuolar-type H+-ATPase subunit E/Vma4